MKLLFFFFFVQKVSLMDNCSIALGDLARLLFSSHLSLERNGLEVRLLLENLASSLSKVLL